jgi:plasmid maintenance system antidote protein VapI
MLAKIFDTTAKIWTHAQAYYDLYQALQGDSSDKLDVIQPVV